MSFTEEQQNALRSLAGHWQDRRFVLTGASALGCHLPMEWRHTNVLDLVVAVDLDEYPAGLDRLPGWAKEVRFEHRWSHCGLAVDIIPAGAELMEEGSITWPESGHVMSLTGVDLAFDHAVKVPSGDDLVVEVAPVPAIVVLKMASFCDRPYERERDLEDLGYILQRYLEDDERCFGDAVLDAEIDYEDVSAFLCGQDVGAILRSEAHHRLVEQFLELVGEESVHFYRFASLRPRIEEQALARRLQVFRLGLLGM